MMTKQDFLAWEHATNDSIDVKRIYIDIAGDLVTGILLSQIIYYYLPSNNRSDSENKLRVEHRGYLWIAKSREDWWEECRITVKQYERSVNILREIGLVETDIFKFNGDPIAHLRLNLDLLIDYINGLVEIKYKNKEDGIIDSFIYQRRTKEEITEKIEKVYEKWKSKNSQHIPKKKERKVKTTTPKEEKQNNQNSKVVFAEKVKTETTKGVNHNNQNSKDVFDETLETLLPNKESQVSLNGNSGTDQKVESLTKNITQTTTKITSKITTENTTESQNPSLSLWEEVKNELKNSMTTVSFNTWINCINVQKEDNLLILSCPNETTLTIVKEKFGEVINELVGKYSYNTLEIKMIKDNS